MIIDPQAVVDKLRLAGTLVAGGFPCEPLY